MQEAHAPALAARRLHRRGEVRETGAGLHVERDRNPIELRILEMREEPRELCERQVGHCVVAAVLERRERHALAGTGDSADQQ